MKSKDNPRWMDQEFKSSRALRRKLEKKWRKDKSEENRLRYVEQRNLCAQLSLKKQECHYAKIIQEAGNDQRSLFKVVNKVLDRNETRALPDHNDSTELANQFNEYYIQKIGNLRKTIPEDSKGLEISQTKFQGEKMEKFDPCSEEELKKVISEFGIKTSTEDPIPAKFLELVVDEALPTLCNLVNKSLSEGSMDGVKLSVLDPLLKKAGLDVDTKKNFRPVNNLVFFSKITERIVKVRLNNHMSKNALHSSSQFG